MQNLLFVCVVGLSLAAWSTFGCEPSDGPSNCKDKSVFVTPYTKRVAKDFKKDIEKGRLREKTNGALNAMIRFAVFKLKAKGHKAEAEKLLKEWESGWDVALLSVGRDLGDHRPLSQWLAEKYAMLEFVLGVDICHALRLDDIKIINYGIPVVFSCVDDVDVIEYEKHFVPLSGTVVYWGSFFTCVGGTWGTGFLFCSPISWGAEFLTEKWIAPALNERVWDLVCK